MDFRRHTLLVVITIWSAAATAGEAAAADGHSLFREQVAPVLARRCLSCHNSEQRKGGFSVETAGEVLESGFVEPGDPAGSYLLEVIAAADGQAPAMPKDSDPLLAEQAAAIRQWIAAGAVWPDGLRLEPPRVSDLNWWSLQPLTPPQVPEAPGPDADRARTPIDAFLLARLRQHQLRPAPPASRRELIRRVYYDLIGLPPEPREVEAFVRSEDPDAYRRLVDRLLASPRYGERWARHWLDVVHYADTHGYDKDKPRPNAWPYRDYVIRSFNSDPPYRRLVREQLAGDVLWPDRPDAVVATGFISAGPWDFIGHVEVPESKIDGQVARNLDRDDMATNTMNSFCSLTVQCARCHHHKLDPVTMQDYYRLQAVFAALDRAERPYDPNPEVARRRRRLLAEQRELQEQLAAVERQIDGRKTAEITALEERIERLNSPTGAAASKDRSPAYGYHSQVASSPDTVKWVQIDLGQAVEIDQLLMFGADEYGWSDFGFPRRFRVELCGGESFDAAAAVTVADETATDFARPGAAPVVIDCQQTARHVRITATGLWNRRRRGSGESGDWIFALGELVVLSQGQRVEPAGVTARDSIQAPPRWSRANLIDRVCGRSTLDSAALARAGRERRQLQQLQSRHQQLWASAAGPKLLARRQRLRKAGQQLQRRLEQLPSQQTTYAATVHPGSGNFRGRAGLGPREIRVLHRGDVKQPREAVAAGTAPLIPNVPGKFDLPRGADEGLRRAALADWIVRRDHPLTWRSIVNRVWQYHFGQGLVDTPNDFGRGGARPSHPELLDYLACDFRDHGQSLKRLHRQICLSAAYQRSSHPPAPASGPDPRQVDAGNRLLWRMNRRRLTAEALRDSVLWAAGRLDLRMGGPGYQDFVIEHPEHSPHYEYHKHDPRDPATHRRSVYRFIVRSQPQPFMNTLDCADPSISVPKRGETLTALQALAMLNNRFMVAMCEEFADFVRLREPDAGRQVDAAFQRVLGRRPAAEESAALRDFARRHGLANTCRLLLNLNEFVFVD